MAYKKALDFLHQFDASYDPLSSFFPFEEKIKFLIVFFVDVMQTLKEKIEAMVKNKPEKARMVLSRSASTRAIPPNDYTLHKKSNYSVLMPTTREASASKGKRKIQDVIDIQESPKKQRVEKEVQSDTPLYSPSQSPIHIGDE